MPSGEPPEAEEEALFWIFGYGSLINNESRAATLALLGSSVTNHTALEFIAELKADFGYKRAFCFRSATGFTALGMIKSDQGECLQRTQAGECQRNVTQGVIFPVTASQVSEFDRREKGYTRVNVPLRYLDFPGSEVPPLKDSDQVVLYIPDPDRLAFPAEDHPILQTYVDTCLSGCMSWGGEVMMRKFCASTEGWSEFFLNDPPMSRRPWLHRPKCWESIDAVLSSDSTHTQFMHRKHAEEYLRDHRKFSENMSLRGMWGCPLRNTGFVGREAHLTELHAALQRDGIVQVCGLGGMGKSSLANEYVHRHFKSKYELVVFFHAETRTALASDLRKFAKEMLQVNTPHAPPPTMKEHVFGTLDEADESKQLAEEEEEEFVAADFRRHLAKSSSFCLVFDSMENTKWIASYLPEVAETSNGRPRLGHIIITSRVGRDLTRDLCSGAGLEMRRCSILQLDSLTPSESLQFLQHALGEDESEVKDASEAEAGTPGGGRRMSRRSFSGSSAAAAAIARMRCFNELGERLGHLPLALSVATAYMKRCDVSAREYLERLGGLDENSMDEEDDGESRIGGHDQTSFFNPDEAISASVGIALERIALECPSAITVLHRLAFLSPDEITKTLVMQLLTVGHFRMDGPQQLEDVAETRACSGTTTAASAGMSQTTSSSLSLIGLGLGGASALTTLVLAVRGNGRFAVVTAAAAAAAATAAAFFAFSRSAARSPAKTAIPRTQSRTTMSPLTPPPISPRKTPAGINKELMIETDRCWETLKVFSLFNVKGTRARRVASIHRMQQAFLRRQVSRAGSAQLVIEQCAWVLRKMWRYEGYSGRYTSGNSSPAKANNEDLAFLDHINLLWSHIFRPGPGTRTGATMPGTGVKADDSVAVPISTTARRNLASLLKDAADYLTFMASNYDTAEALLQRALALELEEKCLMRASATFHVLGMVSRLRGDKAAAQRYLDRCLSMRESLSRQSSASLEANQSLAQTLQEMSLLALRQGNLDEAKNLLSRCRSVFPDNEVVGGGEGCIRLALVNVNEIGQEEHAHIVCDIIDECSKHAKVLAFTVHDFDNDGVFVSVRVDAHASFVKDAIISRTFGEEQHCVHCADKLERERNGEK